MGININFPFQNSDNGDFIELTETNKRAIKSDLMHLILTAKGSRYYMPKFGTNLLQFIFQPNDKLTLGQVKQELQEAVTTYMPNLKIKELTVEQSSDVLYAAIVKIDYTVTEDAFVSSESVTIKI